MLYIFKAALLGGSLLALSASWAWADEAPLLRSTDPGAQQLRAVGKLRNAGGTNCTATLVAGSKAPANEQKALVVTAAHCYELLATHEVKIDQGQPGLRFTPAYFIDTQDDHVSFDVEKVIYATMKEQDIALLQLSANYGQLRQIQVEPLHLLPREAIPGAPITIAQIPVMGVPQDERFLRVAQCTEEKHAFLLEGWRPWYWPYAVANRCAGVSGGSSGSPVLRSTDFAVVGILNTQKTQVLSCGPDGPCEVDAQGELYPNYDTAYAMPVDRLASSIRDDSSVDISHLDPGGGITIKAGTRQGYYTAGDIRDYNGIPKGEPAVWDVEIQPGYEWVRYKLGRPGLDCRSPEGYGAPVLVDQQPLRDLPVSPQDGVYQACLIGKKQGASEWQPYAEANAAFRIIDNVAPTEAVPVAVLPLDLGWRVFVSMVMNEIITIRYKSGLAAETNCDDLSGYRPVVSQSLFVDKTGQPMRMCLRGGDYAFNFGKPQVIDLSETLGD